MSTYTYMISVGQRRESVRYLLASLEGEDCMSNGSGKIHCTTVYMAELEIQLLSHCHDMDLFPAYTGLHLGNLCGGQNVKL